MNTKSASDLRGSVGTGRSGDEGGIRQRERRVRFSGARVAAPHHHPALRIENFCQLQETHLLQVFCRDLMARSIAMPTYQGARAGVERERERALFKRGGESSEERARGSEA